MNCRFCFSRQSSLCHFLTFLFCTVSHHWSGPISVVVFAAGDDELFVLQLYLTYLRRCFATIHERVSFHLAMPKDRAATNVRGVHLSDLSMFNCAKPEQTLDELLKRRTAETKKWRIKASHAIDGASFFLSQTNKTLIQLVFSLLQFPYPQNFLRNVARKNCQTFYTFLTDVDIIMSANVNFAESLDRFLRVAKCPAMNNLCAYVIPTYELDERVRFPRTKQDLIRLANKGLARPFHNKVFIYNQYATNFSR